jgi:hypothetical protein
MDLKRQDAAAALMAVAEDRRCYTTWNDAVVTLPTWVFLRNEA